MIKNLVLLSILFSSCVFGEVRRGDWIGAGGLGLTADPSTFLIVAQAEYVYRPNLFFGPLVQMGFGNGGALFTGSAAGRLVLGRHPLVKPSIEGGVGLTAASGAYSSTIGLHAHFGIGFDYMINRTMSLGTVFRANFAPPVKTFFLSWPLLLLRVNL